MELWKWALALTGTSTVAVLGFLRYLVWFMHPRRYKRTTLLLQLELDYSKAPEVLHQDQAAHDKAGQQITEQLGKFKKNELKVLARQVSEIDPDTIYAMEAPAEFYPKYRTVIECFYAPGSSKAIARICTHLKCYDGVVCIGAALNVFECLEGNAPSPPAIGVPNPHFGYGLWTFWNYLKMNNRLHRSMLASLPKFLSDREYFPSNPLALWREKPNREWHHWSEPRLGFKEIRTLASRIMDRLDLSYVMYTSNYAHERPTGTCSVAMGSMPSVLDLADKDKKLANLWSPTAFVDVDNQFAALGTNSIFWNNYGKHDHAISGRVTGFRWFVPGTPPAFCPIFTVISIHGKVHLLVSLAAQHQAKVEDLLEELGPDRRHHLKVPESMDEFYQSSPEHVPGL